MWHVLSRRQEYDADGWFQVYRERVRVPGKGEHDVFTLEKPDFSVVCPLTPDGRVLALRQYRHGARDVCLDIPAGRVEEGEDALAAAKRELREETGHEAARWTPLGAFTIDANRGYGRAHCWLAEDARRVGDQALDDMEDIEVVPLALDDALARATSGGFRTLAPVACLALAAAHLRAR